MKTIFNQFDFTEQELLDMVAQGYINVRNNEELGISLLDYRGECMIDKMWNNVTNNSRGLVYNSETFEIIGFCLPKFHNFEDVIHKPEFEKYLNLGYEISEKMDGSCIFINSYRGKLFTNTRGSFISIQSQVALEHLKPIEEELVAWMAKHDIVTIICELIDDVSRVVVKYEENQKGLHLITMYNSEGVEVINLRTDLEVEFDEFQHIAKHQPTRVCSLENLQKEDKPNEEGYVIRYEDGYRVKVKFETYKYYHRLITGFNKKSIWKLVSSGGSVRQVLGKIPDEWFDWGMQIEHDLNCEFNRVMKLIGDECQSWIAELGTDRGVIGRATAGKDIQKYIFAFLKGDFLTISNSVWATLEPTGNSVFNKNFSDKDHK